MRRGRCGRGPERFPARIAVFLRPFGSRGGGTRRKKGKQYFRCAEHWHTVPNRLSSVRAGKTCFAGQPDGNEPEGNAPPRADCFTAKRKIRGRKGRKGGRDSSFLKQSGYFCKNFLFVYKTGLIVLCVFLIRSLSVCGGGRADNLSGSELRKMSPSVKAAYFGNCGGRAEVAARRPEKPVYAFVRVSADVSDLYASCGCDELASFGDIQIVCVPKNSLAALARDARIERIETGRTCGTANNLTAEVTGSAKVHDGLNLPAAYTGRGVVVGVEDIGFDLTNPNFYSADMTRYRIKAMWDMLSTDTVGSGLPLGRDYCDEASLLALGHSRDGLTCMHGSHTLGTAAGSGFGSPYGGVAPESDICLVANVTTDNKEYLPEDDTEDEVEEEYGTPLSALGFKYIFDYADGTGQPCVISFSEGSYADFTQDTELYYEVLERMVGKGRIIVASAGNNSQSKCYIRKPAGEERAGSFMMNYGSQLYFMAQGSDDFTARITVHGKETAALDIDTSPLRNMTDSIMYDTLRVDGTEYDFVYVAYPSCYDENNIVVEYAVQGPEKIGYASVAPVGIEFSGTDADVEVYRLAGNFVEFPDIDPDLCDAETSHNIYCPASAPSVIGVGATAWSTGYVNAAGEEKTYDYGSDGERADFSSIGPTLDGRVKPDVAAPGTSVVSSTNSFYFEENPESNQWGDIVGEYSYGGRTYYWKADTGTSMSAPCVAGAIALWLEANPDLTPEDVTEIFSRTCTRTDETLSYPNNYYGWGQIDVYAGMLCVLGMDGIEGVSSSPPRSADISARDGGIAVSFASPLRTSGRVRVYSLSGRLLKSVSLTPGTENFTIAEDAGMKGVVLVQVDGDGRMTTGSVLLRM